MRDDRIDPELAMRLFRSLGVIRHSDLHLRPNASKGEMGILGLLGGMGRDMAPTELADALGISASRVANALRTLESKGYVTRDINPEDRRGIVVRITPKGDEFAQGQLEEAVSELDDALSILGPADAAELVRIVGRLEDYLVKEQGVFRPPTRYDAAQGAADTVGPRSLSSHRQA